MLYKRRIDRFLIVAVPVVIFVYASTRPIKRLGADMPPQFIDTPPSARGKQRAADVELAHKYWELAISAMQWRYTYGSPLPDTPPDDFRLYGDTPSASEPLSLSRFRYWHRFQQVWLLPETWKTSREWSTLWLTDPIMRAGDWFDRTLKDWVGKP
jgi:hypothetical protein